MSLKREESLELLNATHDFPCQFTIKVIGIAENDFVERVLWTVRQTLADLETVPFQTRSTPNGRHVSVTLEPRLESAEQVLLAYAEIQLIEGVVMTM
jgi:putative lipoic acid-binding regulatory protein